MSNLDRAMRILELIAAEPDGVRVTNLAAVLGLNPAIPHRIIAELCELGYVVQDVTSERYRATFKLGSLGLRQLETAGITQWARPELEALARKTKELVRLAVASGRDLRFVAKAQGADSRLTVDSALRTGQVALESASSRAWLSTLPEDEALAVISSRGVAARTPYTRTDLHTLVEEIAQARQLGYAIIGGEMEVGIHAIAVPIVPPGSPDACAVGTVSIAVPSARVTPEVLVAFLPELRATVDRLACEWHAYEYLVAVSGPPGAR